jgi:hypothetical protein
MEDAMKSATCRRIALAMVIGVLFAGCRSSTGTRQRLDVSWEPVVITPSFDQGDGPRVLVDAAHGNYHTIDGRFNAFARLLEADGHVVASADTPVTPQLLADADVFVISNAVKGGADAVWELPTPSAFSRDEIRSLAQWVEGGGSLLLIADHMPMPGATAALADAFGVVFLNGFAMKSATERGALTFTRGDHSLADHAVTRGRRAGERVESVTSFTGQAFRAVVPVEPLMLMPDDWVVLLPTVAWEFSDATPRVSTRGLLQGAVLRHGAGRVAVFGEAAMFTAQIQQRGDTVRYMGMSHPDATGNQQFVLNVLHWLAGRLD